MGLGASGRSELADDETGGLADWLPGGVVLGVDALPISGWFEFMSSADSGDVCWFVASSGPRVDWARMCPGAAAMKQPRIIHLHKLENRKNISLNEQDGSGPGSNRAPTLFACAIGPAGKDAAHHPIV